MKLQCPICQTRLPALPIPGIQQLKCLECGSKQRVELTTQDVEEFSVAPPPLPQQTHEAADPRIQVREAAYGLNIISWLGIGLTIADMIFLAYGWGTFWQSLPADQRYFAILSLLEELFKPALYAVAWSIVVYGSRCMMRLTNYSWAFAACVLGSIPMVSPCLVLGVPFGIWGIVVLRRPKVRAAFRTS